MKKLILAVSLMLTTALSVFAEGGRTPITCDIVEVSPTGVGAIVVVTRSLSKAFNGMEFIVPNMKGFIVGDRLSLSGDIGEPAKLNGRELRVFKVKSIDSAPGR